ncbi:MAG: hypothetical protein KOO63_14140 [Bacteroidales bacterium]|nr:hypothetical protein [Candidatus Latescibacterota bacterium]
MRVILQVFLGLLLTTSIVACNEDPVSPEPDPEPVFEIDTGPDEADYDFYIAMSYSDPQPLIITEKRFYVIIACEDEQQSFQSVAMSVQGASVPLQHVNYGGTDFYIAYFNRTYAEIFSFRFEINGRVVETDLETVSELHCTLPTSLFPQSDVTLNWMATKDPQVIYVEGFERRADFSLVEVTQENLSSDARGFTIPAEWLWTHDATRVRNLQVGIMNYVIADRVCFTISDGAYKSYE